MVAIEDKYLVPRKQIFLSHTWNYDKINRNNHKRVVELSKLLESKGWSVWIDENDMIGNIDASIKKGIDDAEIVLVCLTYTYREKIDRTSKDQSLRDNCFKEWNYLSCQNKIILPIVMEPFLLDIKEYQKTITSLLIGNTLFIDASDDNLTKASDKINETLFRYNLIPNNPPNYKLLSPLNKLKLNKKYIVNKWKFLIVIKFINRLKNFSKIQIVNRLK